jgi:MFS family permease
MNRGGWTALEPRQRHVLMSTVAANALIFLDQTAVAVALPAIGREFDTQAHGLQWVISAYLLALAVFMPAAGPLADNVGRKRLMIVGMLVFGVASAACAVAPSLAFLIICRFRSRHWRSCPSAAGTGQYDESDARRAAWLGDRRVLDRRHRVPDLRTTYRSGHPGAG